MDTSASAIFLSDLFSDTTSNMDLANVDFMQCDAAAEAPCMLLRASKNLFDALGKVRICAIPDLLLLQTLIVG
jgi:hypothetical protein